MQSMLAGCASFNADISAWDISSVTNLSAMLSLCKRFNHDLSGWAVSAVTYALRFAAGADSFDDTNKPAFPESAESRDGNLDVNNW